MSSQFRAYQKVEKCEDFLKGVDTKVMDRLNTPEFNVDIGRPEVAYTVMAVYLEELAKSINEEVSANGRGIEVTIGSLMKISVDNRESSTAEKAGNLTPVVELGEVFKLGLKNDKATEEE